MSVDIQDWNILIILLLYPTQVSVKSNKISPFPIKGIEKYLVEASNLIEYFT